MKKTIRYSLTAIITMLMCLIIAPSAFAEDTVYTTQEFTTAPPTTSSPTTENSNPEETTTQESVYEQMLGDVDNDGYLTAIDARKILAVASLQESVDVSHLWVYDIDKNNIITADDARLALRISSMLEQNDECAPAKFLDENFGYKVTLSFEFPENSPAEGDEFEVKLTAKGIKQSESLNLFFSYNHDAFELISIEKGSDIFAEFESGLYSDGKFSVGAIFDGICTTENIEIATIRFKAKKVGMHFLNCNPGSWSGDIAPMAINAGVYISCHKNDDNVACGICHYDYQGEGNPDDYIHWELKNDGTLIIDGNGTMIHSEWMWSSYWDDYDELIKKAIISDEIVNISDGAFSHCFNLAEIQLPNTIKRIESRAFVECNSLSSIALPDGVEIIEDEAFWDCDSLEKIYIPESITAIGSGVFEDCFSLVDIYYGGSEEDWESISITQLENESLKNVTVHYNSSYEDFISNESVTEKPSVEETTTQGPTT